jgi:sulfur carrier protein ThiS
MRVTVNGKIRQVNIGCRSFVRVWQLIEMLALAPTHNLSVTINGDPTDRTEFATAQIKSGDKIAILLREGQQ